MGEAQRYQVVERIAAGGMAEVYRGESAGIEGFRKKVAIKRVLPKLSANREFINMFLDEARLCAYLSHSRCVQVFDIGQAAGAHFIVMEYVDGADLQGVLEYLTARGQRMPIEAACLITQNVCEGLAYAHDACDHTGASLNIVHRDISPHNVLMTRYGEVKLVDFGLAKASSHLTAEDEDIVKGKFGYLAPEVTTGKGADRRVDIFAAGILLWEMIAGQRLFKGESDLETFKLVQAAHIPDVRQLRPEVSADLVNVLGKALARDPEQRYRHADDFARDLAQIVGKLGSGVTYLDIKTLVEATAKERAKRRKSQGRDTAGVIGDLIIGALHDFSIDVGEAGSPQSSPPQRDKAPGAVSGEFVDPSQWGLDALFDEPPKAPKPAEAAAPAEHLELSEDDVQRAPEPKAAPAAQRARATSAPAPRIADKKDDGPWWRRWFGS